MIAALDLTASEGQMLPSHSLSSTSPSEGGGKGCWSPREEKITGCKHSIHARIHILKFSLQNSISRAQGFNFDNLSID